MRQIWVSFAHTKHGSSGVYTIYWIYRMRILYFYNGKYVFHTYHTGKWQIVVHHGHLAKAWKLAQIFLHNIMSENSLIVSLFSFFFLFLFLFSSSFSILLDFFHYTYTKKIPRSNRNNFFPFFRWKIHLLRHVLSESLLRRNLSISQLAIYELPGTSDLSKFFMYFRFCFLFEIYLCSISCSHSYGSYSFHACHFNF